MIMCCIFSLQALGAAEVDVDDTNDTVLTTTDSDVVNADDDHSSLTLQDNDEVLSEGEGSFTQLKEDIGSQTEVRLTKNYTYIDSDSELKTGINLSGTIKIVGEGNIVIDAKNQARIFNILPKSNVTIQGITFINAYAVTTSTSSQGMGGAIWAKGTVHIDDCKFINNTASKANGGAVCLGGAGSTITNSYFEGNRALRNTANENSGSAGALFINANNTSITNSDFIKNMAGLNGGAIGSSGNRIENCTIINCNIISNVANGSAGGVGMQSKNFHIYNSTFKYNEARGSYTENPTYPGNGGGMVMRGWDSSAYNCTFIDNIAKNDGGASYLTNTSYSPLNNNTGFILCTFINNTAGFNGGAVNWAAGASYSYVEDSIFVNNTAKRSGGAVHWNGHYGSISNSTFTNNNATGEVIGLFGSFYGGGDGGAIVWIGSYGTIDNNCVFTNNYAKYRGGAIFLHGNSTENCTGVTIESSTFNDNFAGTNGGAIDFYEGAHNGNITGCTFNDNIANRSGGAIFWFGTYGNIEYSSFINNKALGLTEAEDSYGVLTYGGYGGAIIWTGPNGNIYSTNFTDNSAAKRGGAIYLQGSTEGNCTNTTFDSCKFIKNHAGTNGGAIDWHEGAHDGNILNSVFEHNTANANGGAVYWRGHNGEIINSNFTNNTALGLNNGTYGNAGDGGAIFWAGPNGTVEHCRFIDNEAKWNSSYENSGRGGAVYLEPCAHGNKNTTFEDVYFENNIACTNGGAINWNGGAEDGLVDNAIFINNTANRNGGAIFWHGQNGTVKNSRFINNRATGTAWEYTYAIKMTDVVIINATAGEIDPYTLIDTPQTGKLYVINQTLSSDTLHFESYVYTGSEFKKLDETDITVSESIISPVDWGIDQYFGGDGGTILWSGDIGLVYNCSFVDSNSARRGGGAYMTGSDYVTYNLCNFTDCTSGTNGGGVDWLAGANYGKIYNCIFNNTRAARSAGAIYYDGWYGEMKNITIINTRSYGGTLPASEDGFVKYAGWDSSHWDTNTTGGDAGAIMFTGSNINITNAHFINCTAQGRGGAVFLQDNAYIKFDSCYFKDNEALGIATNVWKNYTQERNDADDDTKIDYKLTGHGGAISFDVGAHDSSIKNSEFINNYARRDGGAINFAEGAYLGSIENTKFINNSAGDDGGAINWEGDEGTIKNITCYNNTGVSYDDPETGASTSNGGTICLTGDNVTISDSSFKLSTVLLSQVDKKPEGGAIFLTGNNNRIINTEFDTCYSPDNAGAINVIGNNTFIDDCTFENCNATEDGGVLYVSGSYCKLYNSTFNNNLAGDDGGAINWEGSHGIIYNITCFNNRGISLGDSSSNGGTISLTGSNVTISKSNFTRTSAGIAGGAIFITGNLVNITDSVFKMCSVDLTIANSGKEYVNGGGSIYVLGNSSYIQNCNFTRSNGRQGGVIYIQGHNATVDGAITDFTYAPLGGGAIFVNGQNATIMNSNFTRGNSTQNHGGSIYIEGINAKISNSNFTMSMSAKDGGAIYVSGLNATIEKSRFTMNNATDNGGAIYILGDLTKILNSTLIQSHAVKGGAIYISGNHAYLNDSYISMVSAELDGGAIYIAGNNATIVKSTFDKTNASGKINKGKFENGNGGAIYVQGDNSDIIDSTFNITVATLGSGGAIYVGGLNTTISGAHASISQAPNGQGGAIYVNGIDTVISNSSFAMAHAAKEGGTIYIKGDNSKVIGSNLTRTSSDTDGGAVYIDAVNAAIEDSHFVMSNATKAGGAIYIKGVKANVKNSTFDMTYAQTSSNNYDTTNFGGAIYIIGNYANISDSKFNHSSAYQGGVIYLAGSYCDVINSSFENSYAKTDGGALYSTGSHSNVIDSNFTNNLADYDGGAIFWFGQSSSVYNAVDGCIFIGNVAHGGTRNTNGGGAIYWSEGGRYGSIRNSQFINNSVSTNKKSDGGAVLWDNSYHGLIDNCVFDGNYVESTAINNNAYWMQGGSVFLRIKSNYTISNCIFKNSWSIKEGGAVYVARNGGEKILPIEVLFVNNTFINNTAKALGNTHTDGGGAVMVKECENVYFVNSKFINNTANNGGAISHFNARAGNQYINCTFIGNDATNNGGSIWANSNNIYLDNIVIYNSTAVNYGGGLYVDGNIAYYNNLTFINNSAKYSGAFHWHCGSVTIQNMNFINNTATEFGGAIYISHDNVAVKNNNFTGNTAIRGGALYVPTNAITISNNNFNNNSADWGGAIFVPISNNAVSITYSNFTENHANYGGAIYNGARGSNNHYIMYCDFTRNYATIDGGAIYIANTDQHVGYCNFDGNNASGNGGSIYVVYGATATVIHDSTFKNSHADNGGAIYSAGSNNVQPAVTIRNDTFIKNTAVRNGGAVLILTNNGGKVYRDYLNFDNIGVVSDTTKRTDVTSVGSPSTHFIITSLFEDNEDYIFNIVAISDKISPRITVYLTNPNDPRRDSIHFVVNLTNSTTGELIQQIIVTPENYASHYNPETGYVYVTFDRDLIVNETYNITAEFYDELYMIKGNSSSAKAEGKLMGEFQLLQSQIEANITLQRSNGLSYYEITLNRDYRFLEESNGVKLDDRCMNLTNIDRPLIIHGNGWVLDARGFSRIFNITAANVTFDRVIFTGGNASGKYGDGVSTGGAIFWAGENGQLLNSLVDDNYANLGGGIYFNSTASNCMIVNTTFLDNTADTHGGAIDCNASSMGLFNTTFERNYADYGAALCREVNATGGYGVNNTFTDNHAKTAGAALAWMNASSIHIDTYYFYNNTAGYSGGAIYVGEGSGNCEIINCEFGGNYVDNSTGGHGGAIEWYAETGLVLNSSFTNNHAYDGGAIFVGENSGKINITNSDFTRNYAATVGGAISLVASGVTINATNFFDNYAVEGGALYVGGQGETNYVYNSVFKGNNATGGNGGAINWMASSGTIINSNLTSNNAYYGGGIYFGGLSSESTISRCVFTDNHAKYNGGAIDCNASKMYLTHTVFDANYAQYGAALCREINAQSGSGENNTFKNNHAYISGAALGWMGSVGIKIVNYTFINNSADVSGGAIYVSPDSHNCSIIDCDFEDNYVTNKTVDDDSFSWIAWDNTPMSYIIQFTSDSELVNKTIQYSEMTIYYHSGVPENQAVGGAINCLASNATIKNTKFTNNIARLGGALYVGSDSGNTIINGSTFTGNLAYERGGAVNLHASGTHIDDTKFYDNSAINGSALYVGGVGTNNKVHSSIFDGNTATGYGAGIYWIAQEGEIKDSEFTRNVADYGGAIYFNGRSANTNLTNTTFKYNNATHNGGAIDCNAENIGIYNLTFESNYAGEYGAALCREAGATHGHGTHNTFIANHAGISGAGLAWLGVENININYYTFIDNTAGSTGAAIYIAPGSNNAIINHSVFTGNEILNDTYGYGAAIDVEALNAKIINSNFTENIAPYGGAIWLSETSGTTNITNATFTRNEAYLDGGAINLRGEGISIGDVRFYENTAVNNGGAVYAGLTGKTSIIYDAVFEDNKAGSHGGAIDWRSEAGEIKYSNFTDNSAEYGGAIYLNGVSSGSQVSHVIFAGNIATENGGAIDCNATKMNLTHTQFISNVAKYGAALCRESNATGGFGVNNTFISNEAKISGAALAWLGVGNININNYTFINNTAYTSGGAIYVSEGSENCTVRNSTFDNNYVTDVRNGRGGAIDWIGANGYIEDTIFKDSFAVNGGTLYVDNNSVNFKVFNTSFVGSRALGEGGSIVICADNASILSSNFTFSLALEQGGSIAAHNITNITIDDCLFDYNVGAGYVDSTLKAYGEGGAIYIDDSRIIHISNSSFKDIESHSNGGAISAINCNDTELYNLTFDGELTIRNGGAISWINSTNLTIDSSEFRHVSASNGGGAIYLYNMNNTTIKNSLFDDTNSPRGNGGAIHIDGNVTLLNDTFTNFEAYSDWGGAVYINSGNSSIINSTFEGVDAIWVYRNATAYLTGNNITGLYPNKDMHYLERDYDSKYNPVDYAVWNDGDLYLDKNNFDYVIFNNGTIWTNTTTKMLSNQTHECVWNENFTYWADITDDNNNTIISVRTLNTYNQVYQDVAHQFVLPYNRITLQSIYQGVFVLNVNDTGLKHNTVYSGTLKVKMPVSLELNYDIDGDTVVITGTLTPKAQSNYTISGQKLVITIGDNTYYPVITAHTTFEDPFYMWKIANATQVLHDIASGNYKVTGLYEGDDVHLGVENSTSFNVDLQDTWIKVVVNNIVYGQYAVVNVTTNANGTVLFSMNGRHERVNITNGSIVLTLPTLLDPGNYSMGVVYLGNEYYRYAMNSTDFKVFKQNNTFEAIPTNITFGENEIINITLNENATGYVEITIGNTQYITPINHGTAQFNITGLAAGTYENITILYNGDVHVVGNSTNVTFTVSPTDKYDMDVKVDDITYGDNATVRVLVPTTATGNVTIYVDGKLVGTVNITDGVARLENISGLAGGQHTVNVTYNGDSTYAPKNMNTTFNVNPTEDWKMTITVDEHPYGENTTIFIDASSYNLSNKNVTVTIDGIDYIVNLTDGKGNLTLNNLSAGVHSATVNYAGDANYSAKSQIFRPQIPKADPTITLTEVDGNVIATVSGNTTGNVTFYVNGKEYTIDLVNGNATLPNDKLTIGNNSVVAIYNGDKNYTSARAMKNFTVDKLNSIVNVTVNNTVFGNDVKVLVEVGKNQTGFVTITINDEEYSAKIKEGKAIFTLKDLAVGNNYRVNVTYEGSETFHTSTNFTYFNVTKADLDVTVIAQNVTVKENASFIITVPSDFDGKVNITVNGTTYTRDVASIVEIDKLLAGNKNATVVFYNSTKYADKEVNVTFVVSRVDPTINVTIADVTYPDNASAVVKLSDNANGTVEIYLGNTLIGTDTIVNGQGTVDLTRLSAGLKEVTVKFITSDYYNNNVTATVKFTVNKADTNVVIIRNGTDVIAIVDPAVSGNVTFYINGVKYENVTVNGNATIKDKLVIGNNSVVAIYSGNENYTGSRNSTVFDILKISTDLTVVVAPENVVVGKNTTITVTMVNVTSGKVIIEVNGYNYTADINDGVAELAIALPVGSYTAKAYYLGDETHYASNNTSNAFNVLNKTAPIVNITADVSVEIDNNLTFTVNTTSNATLVVKVNGEIITAGADGKYHYNGTVAGVYTITAEVAENDYYFEASNSTEFTVYKHSSAIDSIVANTSVVLGKNTTITVTMNNVTSGTVLIEVGGHNYTVAIVDKVAELTIGLPVGNYTAKAYFLGDDKYNASKLVNDTVFKVVDKQNATVIINAPSVVEIEGKLIFNVTNSTPVVVTINGKVYTPDVNGNYTFDADKAGNYTIVARSAETDEYYAGFNTTTFIVVKHNATVNITVGDKYEIETDFEIGIENSTAVNVTINGKEYPVVGGKVVIETTKLAAGNYTVVATIYESDKYVGNVTSKTFIIYKHNAVIASITVPDIKVGVGKNATITVTMGNVTSGSVLIEVGGHNYTVDIVNSVAKVNVTLPIGKYTARAYYLGDDKYNATTSQVSAEFTVADKEIPEIIITAPGEIEVDHNITFTVTNSTPVNVTVNGVKVELKDGKYTFNATEAGVATIIVRSAETDDYYAGFNSTTFNVFKHNSIVSIDDIANHYVGDNFEITIHNNTDVVVTINGKEYPVVDGKVVIDTTKLLNGTYIVTAYIKENDKYLENISTKVFNITKRNSSINITVDNKYEIETDFEIGIENSTVVNVTINGKVYEVANGKVVIDTTKLAAGNYTVIATIYESDKYNANVTVKTFEIFKHAAVIDSIIVPTVDTVVGKNITITVNMGNVTSGSVLVEIAGHNYTVDIKNKVAELSVVLPEGNYTAKAYFLGDDKYNATDLGNATVFKVTAKQNATVIINAPSVVEIEGKLIFNVTNSTPVVVTINGKVVEIGADGNYTFDADVAGNYTIVARSAETDEYYAGFNTTTFKVIKHNSTVNITVNPTYYVGDSVVIGVESNATVNVTVNGKSYAVVGGKVTVPASDLVAGNYTVTATVYESDKYLANSTTKTFKVIKAESSIKVEVNDINVGEVAQINVTGPSDISGVVIVNVDGTNYTVILTEGKGSVKVANLGNGTYDIKATYLENAKYSSSVNDTEKVTVSKVTPSISASVENITLGQNAVFEVTLPEDATGTVTINVNGTPVTVGVTGGVNRIIVDNLAIGTYDVNITYNGNDKYLSNSTKVTLKVGPASIKDGISVEDLRNGTVIVHVPENATGNVTIKIGDHTYNATVENGTAVIDLVNETPGTYEATVIYSGDENNTNATLNATIRIDKYATPISIDVNNTVVGNVTRIIVTVDGNITNNVTIEIDGVKYSKAVTGGKAIFEIENLTAGAKTVVASYAGDDSYLANATTEQFTVDKLTSSVSATTKDIDVGQIAVINITAPNYNGTAIVNVNGTNYVVIITGGKGQLELSGLASGKYNINVTYVENDKYLSSTYNATLTVSKVKSEVAVVFDNITSGDVAVINITVPSDATGNVTVKVGSDTYTVGVVSGKAQLVVPGLKVGDYDVTVTYNGDGKYLANSTASKLNVGPASIKEGITVDDLGNGTVVVKVPNNATGNVTVKIGDHTYNATVENGTAVIDLVNETPGIHEATVIYSGDGNHTGATINKNVTIPKYETPMSIEVDNSYVGDKVQVIVTVPENVTGNVTIEIDGVNHTAKVEDGKAVFEITDLKAGNKTVTATYAGDDSYEFNSTTTQFVVSKRNAPISVSVEGVDAGEEVTIKVSDLPSDATGYVIVDVNGTEYGINITDTKEIKVPITKSGTYTVKATYLGDDKYLTNASETSFKAEKVSGDVSMSVENTTVGHDVIVKVTVPSDAEGNVTVTIGNITKVVNVTGGENVIPISGVSEGTHEATVTYSGDSKYDSKTLHTTVTVSKSIIVPSEHVKRGWNSPFDYQAEFLDKNGNILPNTNVQFIVNGKTYTVKTDSEGIAYLTDSHLGVGTYDITVVNPVTGEKVTNKVTIVKRLLENKDITMDFVDGTYYIVKAIGDDGNPVGEGEFVDIFVNGIHYSSRTDANGYAKLKLNLNPGKYTITAEYKNTKVSNKLVVKQTLKLVKKTVKVKKGKKLVLKAKLKWSNGKAIKGKIIKFTFKGKTYKAKTNSKGIAKVTIKKKVTKKLKKGKKYAYSAKYLTNIVKGKVKVKK